MTAPKTGTTEKTAPADAPATTDAPPAADTPAADATAGVATEEREPLTDDELDAEVAAEIEAEQAAEAAREKDGARVGTGAFGVVAAGLGLASLTGTWLSDVVSQRETLLGQIKNPSTPAQQITEIYGDAWHTTALVNGVFALLAVLVGLAVIARPAFGTPGRPLAAWIRATAWGGVALGVLGLLLAVAMYFDLLLALPTAG
ncbi:hypothetical protein [Streptomyces sp. NPDC060194]|uniref:hypothetical protein n=1 Tax=Streptomyces sp. NPDC060194 TaxID=3347069 RepID=UPI0036473C6B